MSSTNALRLGAFISASALTLSLGTVQSSSAESPHPFGTASTAAEGHRDGRLATGADLARTSAARSSGSASTMATATVNVTKLKAHSALMNDPVENYIDVEPWVNDDADLESIESINVYLTVDGKKSGPYEVWYDDELDVNYVQVPDTIGLGKARFYGSMVHYKDLDKASTWDSTDSNSFYVRRDVYYAAAATHGLSASGKTKTFNIEAMGIYSPSIDNFKTLGTIKLQYKTGGKWKTKKTISLNADGNGTYKFVKTTKYYYRIISGQTSTWIGFKKTFPKI